MWIFHIYSCFCISDMNLFYNHMSTLGFNLEKSNYFFDYFSKNNVTKNLYFVLPRNYFNSSEELILFDSWEFFTKSKNYFIFINRNAVTLCQPALSIENIDSNGVLNLLGIVFFPICLFYIIKDTTNIYTIENWASLTILGIAIFSWLGFLWSAFIEAYEMIFFSKHDSLLPRNKIRYYFSVAILIISNIAHILLIILILYNLLS